MKLSSIVVSIFALPFALVGKVVKLVKENAEAYELYQKTEFVNVPVASYMLRRDGAWVKPPSAYNYKNFTTAKFDALVLPAEGGLTVQETVTLMQWVNAVNPRAKVYQAGFVKNSVWEEGQVVLCVGVVASGSKDTAYEWNTFFGRIK